MVRTGKQDPRRIEIGLETAKRGVEGVKIPRGRGLRVSTVGREREDKFNVLDLDLDSNSDSDLNLKKLVSL